LSEVQDSRSRSIFWLLVLPFIDSDRARSNSPKGKA